MSPIPDAIEESLSFDISQGLTGIGQLSDALDQVVQTFQVGLADALSTLTNIGTDVAPLAESLDVAGLGPAVDQALVDATSTPLPIAADTSGVTDAIDQATAVTPTVSVEGDTTAAQDAIAGLSATPVDIPITVDTSEAQTAINSIDTSTADTALTGLGDASEAANSKLGGLSSTLSTGIESAANIASGDISSLGSSFQGLGVGALSAGAGLVVFGGFVDKAINVAAQGQAANNLFNATFGRMAEAVKQVNVGGLTISFDDLAKTSGTVNSDLELSAARIGALGNSSGTAAAQVVKTTDQVLALAGTLAVTNPALGDTAQVTDRLTKLLQNGGARLGQFGISLTAAQIKNEALKLGLETTSATLTPFDKLVAGAQLAVDQFGTSLGLKFAAGSQNAQVQLRALKVALEETLGAIGQPLLQPTITFFADLLPVVQQLGIALGNVGQIILPLLNDVAPILVPLGAGLKLVSDGLGGIATVVGAIPGPLVLVAGGLAAIGGTLLTALVPGLAEAVPLLGAFGGALDFATGPIGITLIALAALGGLVDAFTAKDQAVTAATKNWSDALFGAASGATTLDTQVGLLNTNITATVTKFIEGVPAGSRFRQALNDVGGGTRGLQVALTGTKDTFDAYVKSVTEATLGTDKLNVFNSIAARNAKQALETQRAALQGAVEGQLANLVSTNQLTTAQLKQIDTTFRLGTATADYVGALKQATIEADKAAADQAAAQDKTAASAKGFSAAAQQIFADLASGKTTTDQAKASFESLGLTVATAGTDVTAFSSALSSFLSSASKVPDASSAITSFIQGSSQAATAQTSTIKSQQSVIDSVQRSEAAAYGRIVDANEKGGKNVAQNVKTAQEAFTNVVNAGTLKEHEAANKVLGATEALFAAAAPQKLIDQLKTNLKEIADFEANLAKIVNAGGIELAQQFAQQGAAAAGAQAAAFAVDPKGIRSAEALISRGDSAKIQYVAWIKSVFGPAVGAEVSQQLGLSGAQGVAGLDASLRSGESQIGAAGTALGGAASAHFRPDFSGRVSAQINAAASALAADPTIGQAAGQKALAVVEAFKGPLTLEEAVHIALGAAHTAIQNDPSLATAAGQKGKDTAGAFKPDIKTAAVQEFAKAAALIPGLSNTPNAAALLGVRAGEAFAQGLANGLSNGTQVSAVAAAAGALAGTADAAVRRRLGIKSPSQVGAVLGQQFSQGLALGIVDATPQAASASVVLAAAVVKQLQDALAAATRQSSGAVQTATQQAFTSFLSTAGSALTTVTSDISTFSSNLTSALSAQSSALTSFHKASSVYATDQAAITKLQGEAFIAGLALTDAQNKYNDAAAALPKKASPAQKQFVAQLRQDLTAAQSTFNHFNNQLQSEVTRTATALTSLRTAEAGLDKTQSALSAATDPATFTRNLRAQTAAANQFARDIAKLNREGFTDLAKQLADAGPAAAGALARGFAKSPAKAKSAEAAVDAANTFATQYQAELTRLFGPAGGAAGAAATAGQTIGAALTTGFSTATQAGTAHALGNLSNQIRAGIPSVLPLVQPAVPQKAITPVAANAPTVIQTPTLAGAAGAQTLELDLTIVLDDGRTVNAKTSLPFTPARTRSLKQLVRGEVHAS